MQIKKMALLLFWGAFFSHTALFSAAEPDTQTVCDDDEDIEPEEIIRNQERNKLFIAAANGNTIRIKELLKSGNYDINTTTNKYGWTALHYAIFFLPKHKSTETVLTLLMAEADMNAQECTGNTPLHFYTLWRHLKSDEYAKVMLPLFHSKPDLALIKNHAGKTPKDIEAEHAKIEQSFNAETFNCDCITLEHARIDKKLIEENLPYFKKYSLPYFRNVASYAYPLATNLIEIQLSDALIERLNG
ncbi:ankyrin repeat domain-containing protein [Candidatus Babeliales bacterium]|nr:ankyrin repeat domain-containing protein [Candidatus Babeliales bacterium]